jgi:polysaccharide export outer membrane protein
LALLAAAGCGGPATVRGPATAAIVDLTNPGLPLPIERFAQPDGARIAPGDFLELRVFGFLELSGTFLVAQDGKINLNLVGPIQAAGRTGAELDDDITKVFAQYYRNIDVALNVSARAERNVYVLGEVLRPGRFDFKTGERVLHALADGGGLTPKARENSIMLLRREADGVDHAYRLDFGHLHETLSPKDIYLQPGDVVFVPKSRFSSATDFALSFLDVLGRASTTALVVDNLSSRVRSLTIAR